MAHFHSISFSCQHMRKRNSGGTGNSVQHKQMTRRNITLRFHRLKTVSGDNKMSIYRKRIYRCSFWTAVFLEGIAIIISN